MEALAKGKWDYIWKKMRRNCVRGKKKQDGKNWNCQKKFKMKPTDFEHKAGQVGEANQQSQMEFI